MLVALWFGYMAGRANGQMELLRLQLDKLRSVALRAIATKMQVPYGEKGKKVSKEVLIDRLLQLCDAAELVQFVQVPLRDADSLSNGVGGGVDAADALLAHVAPVALKRPASILKFMEQARAK